MAENKRKRSDTSKSAKNHRPNEHQWSSLGAGSNVSLATHHTNALGRVVTVGKPLRIEAEFLSIKRRFAGAFHRITLVTAHNEFILPTETEQPDLDMTQTVIPNANIIMRLLSKLRIQIRRHLRNRKYHVTELTTLGKVLLTLLCKQLPLAGIPILVRLIQEIRDRWTLHELRVMSHGLGEHIRGKHIRLPWGRAVPPEHEYLVVLKQNDTVRHVEVFAGVFLLHVLVKFGQLHREVRNHNVVRFP